MNSTASAVLLGTAVAFAIFLLLRSRIALAGGDPERLAARQRIAEARRRARARRGEPEAADAWREASRIALDELGRPGLAASYARRADRAAPRDGRGLEALVAAMRRAGRHRALERLLWRRLDVEGLDTERAVRLFGELLALYEGPLRRPAQARVLRRLWDAQRGAGPAQLEAP